MKVAIIGFGYWGPNLLRNFNSLADCKVKYVCDSRNDRLAVVNRQYPGVTTTTDPETVFADADVDAIVIATPVFTHFDLAKKALLNGKHVLVEKPLTSTSAEALELKKIAAEKKKVIMV